MKSYGVIRLSLTAAAAAALLIFIAGCYFMPGSGGGNAKVAIGVKGVPPNLTSTALVVTAPGMATISTTASTTAGSITVSVPAGPARTFTLMLNSPSATLEGVATVDLQPGESTTINVTPTLGATQLVIPDFSNGQIVQISDMSGTGWTALSAASFTGIVAFTPYAVDFDNLGRIYIANYASTSPDGVFRIDDINHPSSLALVDGPYAAGINALAIDRTNGLIYYTGMSLAGGPLLNVKAISNIGATATSLSLATLALPTSIAVDDQGMLYMVIPSTTPYVVKYNPTTQAVVATSSYSFAAPPLSSVVGIMVKGPYVYVGDVGAGKIVRFDMNLNFIDSFPGPATDPFYGPETFLAILNRKFTVIDEKSGAYDRIASFDDMTGAGWTTYGSSGFSANTPGIFNFYGFC